MAYRAFFALPVDKFATSTGQPTNAVHGFISMLATLLRVEEPTHVAVAFDAGSTTFRTERYPQYKGTRDATPEPFKGQVPLIKEVLDAMRIRYLDKDLFEADDILATLSSQADALGMDVLVCSGDRDSLQFVNKNVTVLYPIKGVSELARMTPDAVQTKYGVTPTEYSDLAALVGETSDNLPGVPGVGPKTAAKWINQFGGLRGIIENAGEISGKAGESLRAHLDQVRLNRELNHLLTDVDLPYGPDDLIVQPWDRAAMNTVFDALQFRSLRERLFAMHPAAEDIEREAATIEIQLAPYESGSLTRWFADRGQELLGLEVSGRPP
jgi:DNA polymerase I